MIKFRRLQVQQKHFQIKMEMHYLNIFKYIKNISLLFLKCDKDFLNVAETFE